MKKYILIVVAVMLVCTLLACGKNESTLPVSSAQAESKSASSVSSSAPVSSVLQDAELEGSWQDNIYTNQYLGLLLTLPPNEGWTILPDDEKQQFLTMWSNIEFAWGLERAPGIAIERNFVDVVLSGGSTGIKSTVIIQHIGLLPQDMTEQECLDIMYDNIRQSTSVESEIEKDSFYTTEIGSETYLCFLVSSGGSEMFMALHKTGDVYTLIVIEAGEGADIADMLAWFEKIE
ncbi:MAG: hypothetical protein ACK5JF_13970 [Oscillospiraceae bacterium]